MDIDRNISRNIRKYRKAMGMNQRELAEKHHLSNPTTL